jgi:peptidoglycan/xylan/chitin deacetylase (PgdA/CDA1 family)
VTNLPGALVISLDFELLWGVRDLYPGDGGSYRRNLLGARSAIPRLLDLFAEYEIAATWATVGLLGARNRADAASLWPEVLPRFNDPALDPYDGVTGEDEASDPLRYAASLIELIVAAPRQELGSHTFGHYYPLEPGHDADAFRSDLAAAVKIGERFGVRPRSLVIPRNQLNRADLRVIAEAGFTSVRDNARGRIHRACSNAEFRVARERIGRIADAYVPLTGRQVGRWDEIPVVEGVALLPASHFLRPRSHQLRHLEPIRFKRLSDSIRAAAKSGGVCHLWWHPHNFGVDQDENLAFLRRLFDVYRACQAEHGMVSMSMAEATDALAAAQPFLRAFQTSSAGQRRAHSAVT